MRIACIVGGLQQHLNTHSTQTVVGLLRNALAPGLGAADAFAPFAPFPLTVDDVRCSANTHRKLG